MNRRFARAAGPRWRGGFLGCAIHTVAPTCEHCGCRIIGHGAEAGGRMFCRAHCAREAAPEAAAVADRA